MLEPKLEALLKEKCNKHRGSRYYSLDGISHEFYLVFDCDEDADTPESAGTCDVLVVRVGDVPYGDGSIRFMANCTHDVVYGLLALMEQSTVRVVEFKPTRPVKFTATNRFGVCPDGEDDVYTVAEFREACRTQSFADYDGYGYPVRDGMADTAIYVRPSKLHEIPDSATHIAWFNK